LKLTLILPAAGAGTRFNANQPDAPSKIETDLVGKAVFMRAVELFTRRDDTVQVILAVPPDRLDAFKLQWGDTLGFHGITLAPGGTVERWETVANALNHVDDECTHIAVHDAARPMTDPAMIDRVLEAARQHGAAIPGVAVSNTLKRVEPMNDEDAPSERDPLDDILGSAGKPNIGPVQRVTETVPRDSLVEVQTPQVFDADLLRRAYAQIAAGKLDPSNVTDDASLVEALGETVVVVEGDPLNLKLTRPTDLELATAILTRRETNQAADLGRKRLFADDDEDE